MRSKNWRKQNLHRISNIIGAHCIPLPMRTKDRSAAAVVAGEAMVAEVAVAAVSAMVVAAGTAMVVEVEALETEAMAVEAVAEVAVAVGPETVVAVVVAVEDSVEGIKGVVDLKGAMTAEVGLVAVPAAHRRRTSHQRGKSAHLSRRWCRQSCTSISYCLLHGDPILT